MVRPRIVGIIPARMASSRFPGKPMELIHGMPMIGHCYFRTSMCSELDEVVVATCDEEISRFIESIGGSAIMTSPSHERASDRTAEAMLKIEERSGKRVDIVVMVQGDEPMDTPKMISSAIAPMLNDPDLNVVNLMGKIRSIAEFDDPNTVRMEMRSTSLVSPSPLARKASLAPICRSRSVSFRFDEITSWSLISIRRPR